MRRSWRLEFENARRWIAAGFVYAEGGRNTSVFIKPFPHNRPVEKRDIVVIGLHRKLSTAKRAVETYARRKGFVRIGRWE